MSNRTESTKDRIWAGPCGKLHVDDLDKLGKSREVSVVKPESAKQLPDTLDRVELRTIRRKEEQDKVWILCPAPIEMKVRVMIPGIVDDNNDLATATAGGAAELAKEMPAGLGIKMTLWLGRDESPVFDSNRTEVADAFAGRRMTADRIANFWWDPHSAAAAMLLEMDFIHRPEFDVISSCESLEFFLLRPAFLGPLEQLPAWVCADEIRVDETAAGIAGHVMRCRTAFPESSTTAGHPKAAPASHSRRDSSSALPPLVSFRSAPTVNADLDPLGRSTHRNRISRSEQPSWRPFHANPQVHRLPADSSFPPQPAKRRATDGRSVHRGCVESRPGVPRSSLPGRISSALSCANSLNDGPSMSN